MSEHPEDRPGPAPTEHQGYENTFTGQAHNVAQAGTIHGDVHVGDVTIVAGREQIGAASVETVPLDVARLEYGPVLADQRPEEFTGREWLVERIERLLSRRGCERGANVGQYVLVRAGAGLGKTAVAAELARRWECVHHFTRADGGRTRSALQSLAAQLIERYELHDRFAPQGILPSWAGMPAYFPKILAAAADAVGDGGQVRIVIDALDEATADGGLALGLPKLLPAGVAVVATHRDGMAADRLPSGEHVSTLTIEATDPANLADIAEYLGRQARGETIAARLTEADVAESEFVDLLTARCGGVWVYLRYVLSQMRVGPWSKRQLDVLPPDLARYYRQQLAGWRQDDRFHAQDLVLLATLAVVGQPVSLEQLARLTSLGSDVLRTLCHTRYRPFLSVDVRDPARPVQYEIRHTSLREFLHDPSASGGDPLDAELRVAIRDAHHRIADHYLRTFGGTADLLSTLDDHPELADLDDRYALRHLPAHLRAAGLDDELRALLTCRRGSALSTVWADAHDRAGTLDDFLTQLNDARATAETATDAHIETDRPAPDHVAAETRCALVAANLVSRANAIPVTLVEALVQTGVWDLPRALSHARRLHEPIARAAALTSLIPLAGNPELAIRLSRDAHATANLVADDEARLTALTGLLDHLAEPDRNQAWEQILHAATAVPDYSLSSVLRRLAPRADEARLQRLLNVIAAMGSAQARAHELAELMPSLTGQIRNSALRLAAAATAVESMSDDWARPWALAETAARLPEPDRSHALDKALDEALRISDKHSWDRDKALVAIASHLNGEQLDRVLRATGPQQAPAPFFFGGLAPFLDEPQLAWVLDMVVAMGTAELRGSTLVNLLPHLAGSLRLRALGLALDAVTAVTRESTRLHLLVSLVPLIEGQPRARTLNQILTMLPSSSVDHGEEGSARILADIGEYLGAAQLDQALEMIVGTGSPWHSAMAAKGLARKIGPARLQRIADAVSTAEDEPFLAALISGAAPYLSVAQLDRALEVTAAMRQRDNIIAYTSGEVTGEHTHPDDRYQISYDTATVAGLEWPHVRALVGVAPYLDDGRLGRAVEIAAALNNGEARVKALAGLCPYQNTTVRALEAVAAITDEWSRVRALAALPSLLTPAQLDQTLDIASGVADNHFQAMALAGLAAHLGPRQLMRAREIADNMTNRWSRIHAMGQIGVRLAEPARTHVVWHVLELAASLGQQGPMSKVLVNLAPHLTGRGLDGARSIAFQLTSAESRAAALTALAPRFSGETKHVILHNALQAANAIDNNVSRITALAVVAGELDGPIRTAVAEQALHAAATLAEKTTLSVPDLVPVLDSAQLDKILDIATTTRNESRRADLLQAVAARLDEVQLDRALRLALALPRELAHDSHLFDHELFGSACVALYTRLAALADSVTPRNTIDLVRRLYDARPPRSLLLTVTGVTASAIARAAGPESVARQFDTLVEL